MPTAVAGGLSFDRVTAAAYVTCGESTGDRAYCWGGGRLSPYAVLGGLTFAQVSAGGSHICGKQTATSLGYCWGGNSYGELGDGTTTGSETPVAVAGPM